MMRTAVVHRYYTLHVCLLHSVFLIRSSCHSLCLCKQTGLSADEKEKKGCRGNRIIGYSDDLKQLLWHTQLPMVSAVKILICTSHTPNVTFYQLIPFHLVCLVFLVFFFSFCLSWPDFMSPELCTPPGLLLDSLSVSPLSAWMLFLAFWNCVTLSSTLMERWNGSPWREDRT